MAPSLACHIDALDEEQRSRHARLSARLAGANPVISELGDGYSLGLVSDGEMFVALAEWVTLERLCCPFLRFELGLDGELMALRLRGPEGVKDFLRDELHLRVPEDDGAPSRLSVDEAQDEVTRASADSFPASDPPSHSA